MRLHTAHPTVSRGRLTIPVEIDLSEIRFGEPFEITLRLELLDRRRAA
jgi:hypothetical protein